MAINFPNSPVNGNTYTYQNIVYTFVQPDTSFDGYWAVVNPSDLSAATSAEINEGTTDSKFNTPLGLNGSKYVREDEASGETTLNHNGVERLKTTAQGTVLSGKLLLSGDTEKGGVKVGFTELYSGAAIVHAGNVPLDHPITDFDSITVYGNRDGFLQAYTYDVAYMKSLLGAAGVFLEAHNFNHPTTNNFVFASISMQGSTASLLRVNVSQAGYPTAGVNRVVGFKSA